ncbi:MAG: HAMP domain-containing sensor histidine kinase [Clostridium sp.]|nr:HAMP domain-containing sensor histidine kinase [Clostridium sp.]
MIKTISNIILGISIISFLTALFTGIVISNKGVDNSYLKIMLPHYKEDKIIKYAYMVEGTDNSWTECTSDEIDVNYLPYGKHNIIIRPEKENGTYGEYTKLSVKVRPPIWKSTYAYILYAVIIGLIVYSKNKEKCMEKIIKKRAKALTHEMDKNLELPKKVLEAEESRNSYFVNMSHELRTPINVISSTCQLILELNNNENGIEKNKLEHYINVCRKNAYNLLQIVNDIIDMDKIKSDNFSIDIDKYDIVSLVEDCALILKDYVEKKGIEMIIDPEVEEKSIECDKRQIERCIVNLIGNAFKFTSPGGFIKVFVKDLGDNVQIEVRDNGRGIAKENHEAIFNRFNQVCSKNTPNKGSGLGLTITKQIIENHNGSIYVESEIGKGSSFIITLPVKYIENDVAENIDEDIAV